MNNLNNIIIKSIITKDIRFPTSKEQVGSDAMNTDPDYSAAYVILTTNEPKLSGHGLTFTIGRGNELCVAAINSLAYLVKGLCLGDIAKDMAGFYRRVTGDSQLRWVGPEKGVIHMATGALVNAVWDLYAKAMNKPLWLLLGEMSPTEFIKAVDFTYIEDAITPKEALALVKKNQPTKAKRIAYLKQHGYPAYTTSAGWFGYSDEKVKRLSEEAKMQGFKYMKMKVGGNLKNDLKRAGIIRKAIGGDMRLMMDANQKWGVNEAIANMKQLAKFKPWWIEEPTSPDDVLGHAKIAQAVKPIKVATGEHCQNKVMFKQLMQAKALGICQIDSCRVAGVNEILAIQLMAAKFKIPVCPHAGGVGLCEYVQHLAMVDFVQISASMKDRIIEYVDHLHEHFIDPVIIKKGCYQAPTLPGYSIEIKPASIKKYTFKETKKGRQ